MDQVQKWPHSQLREFWSKWYFPANATLYVVGDLDRNIDETKSLIAQVCGAGTQRMLNGCAGVRTDGSRDGTCKWALVAAPAAPWQRTPAIKATARRIVKAVHTLVRRCLAVCRQPPPQQSRSNGSPSSQRLRPTATSHPRTSRCPQRPQMAQLPPPAPARLPLPTAQPQPAQQPTAQLQQLLPRC